MRCGGKGVEEEISEVDMKADVLVDFAVEEHSAVEGFHEMVVFDWAGEEVVEFEFEVVEELPFG